MDPSTLIGYTNTYPTRFAVKPRYPTSLKRAIQTIETIFQYDIITPYGVGTFVNSNPDTTTSVLPAFGMIVRISILAPGPATLNIQVDLVDGTFTEIDTSPIAILTSTKVQTFTIPTIPCFQIRGRLTGDGSTYTISTSCTDY
jgi:hypothetical protein